MHSVAPVLFAHRGGHGPFRENSAAAFERALADGATGLETDVRLAAGGVPVLHHDPWIVRPPRLAPVPWLSTASLQRAGVLAAERFAEQFLRRDVLVSVDIKQRDAGAAFVAAVRRVVPEALGRVLLCCGRVSELVEARHLDSRVRLVHSGRSHRFAADFEDHCRWLLDRGIGIVNMPLDDWTGERLDIARRLGVGVFASLINDAERMRRALAVGVAAVYTDRVAAMVGLLAGES